MTDWIFISLTLILGILFQGSNSHHSKLLLLLLFCQKNQFNFSSSKLAYQDPDIDMLLLLLIQNCIFLVEEMPTIILFKKLIFMIIKQKAGQHLQLLSLKLLVILQDMKLYFFFLSFCHFFKKINLFNFF